MRLLWAVGAVHLGRVIDMLVLSMGDSQKKVPWQEEKALHLNDTYIYTLANYSEQLKADNNACCHVCNFNDGQFLEIDHIDGNHQNFDPSNLKPICSFCHRTKHLGWIATDNCAQLNYADSGKALKDMDYAVVNLWQRFILIGKYTRQEIHNPLIHHQDFELIFQQIDRFHTLTNYIKHPAELCQILEKLTDEERALFWHNNNEEKTKGYFIPIFNIKIFEPISSKLPYTLNDRLNYYYHESIKNPIKYNTIITQRLQEKRQRIDELKNNIKTLQKQIEVLDGTKKEEVKQLIEGASLPDSINPTTPTTFLPIESESDLSVRHTEETLNENYSTDNE